MQARRREAGVPEKVAFATKGELARAMLQRVFEVGVPAAWVTASKVYGEAEELQRWLDAQGRSAVLPQAGDWVDDDIVRGRARMWPYGPYPTEAATGRLRWVLELQSKARPDAHTYYRAYGPRKTSLAELWSVVRKRWTPGGPQTSKGRGRARPIRGALLGRLAPSHHLEPVGARRLAGSEHVRRTAH